MTAIGLVSAKGAPGVTTSALLLAAVWPRPAYLVEADPAGGDVRWWHTDPQGQPLRPDTGVVSLLAAHRRSAPPEEATGDLRAHTQVLTGGLQVLIGVSTPAQHAALGPSWPQLADALTRSGDTLPDAVVDAGRLGFDPPTHALLRRLPLVLLVCRPTVSGVAHARHALDTLRTERSASHGHRSTEAGPAVGVVVIGTPAQRDDVRTALPDPAPIHRETPGLFVGHLAEDPTAAAGLAGIWTRRLERSPLVASGRRLVTDLQAHLQQLTPPPGRDPRTVPAAALAGEVR